jgi:predicted extracellular nuclease
MLNRRVVVPLLLAALAFAAPPVAAQILLTTPGVPYTQDFNTLAQTGLTNVWTNNVTPLVGWYAAFQTGTLTVYRADTGSSNTGALYSYGVAGTNPITDRALGSVSSGTPVTIFYAVRFANNTGAPVGSLAIAYNGEQWRNGGNATAQKLTFEYQVAAPATITGANNPTTGWIGFPSLDFTGPIATVTAGALDGNAAANRTALSATLTFLIPVAAGQEIWLRWRDINDTGNDHGLAIDDLSVMVPVVLPPIVPTCASPLTTTAGTPTSEPLTAVDLDNIVNGAAITLITPSDPGTITLSGFTASPANNTNASVTLNVGAGTPANTFAVTTTWSNDAAPAQTATCTVSVVVNPLNLPIVPNCAASLTPYLGSAATLPVSASDADGTVTGASLGTITPSDPGTITLTGFLAAGAVGGTATTTLNAGAATPAGTYSVPIVWTNDDVSPQTATCTVNVVVTATTAIHDIQGSGMTSPLVSTIVTTRGVVTALRSNGFFLQTPDAQADADPNTSEGIFVFTSSAPPVSAAVGNDLTVTGTVQEFIPSTDPLSPPATELGSPSGYAVNSTGNPLPAPITLTPAETTTTNIENLERFEGMRVHVDSLTVVAPTQGTINEANATSATNGTFYGVVTGVPRPFREPGIQANDPAPALSGVTICPTGAPACVPRFDFNPERLRVDSDAQTGAAPIEVSTGAILANMTGVLDYGFRTYTILPDPSSPPTVTPGMSATPVTAPTAFEFTVASANLERFFDTTNDPATSDAVLTTTAFNNRLNKASLAIRNFMGTPDIIGVEEMENLTTLQALATKVNADAVAASQPNPNYQAFLVEGNDIGGIDVGFLVKTARVSVVDVTQFGLTTTYIDPITSLPALLNDRPPLVLRATITGPSSATFPVTVIVNHLRSLSGVDDPVDGNRVRTKRRAQAEDLANLVQTRQLENLVVLGDFNAFEFNDGYVDGIGTIMGTPTAVGQVVLASSVIVSPILTNLDGTPPPAERYSYTFDGDAQTLDHVLANAAIISATTAQRIEHARINADFPDSFRNDPNRPERISDHDPVVAYFQVATFPVTLMSFTAE